MNTLQDYFEKLKKERFSFEPDMLASKINSLCFELNWKELKKENNLKKYENNGNSVWLSDSVIDVFRGAICKLHNGENPWEGLLKTLETLEEKGVRLNLKTNSGLSIIDLPWERMYYSIVGYEIPINVIKFLVERSSYEISENGLYKEQMFNSAIINCWKSNELNIVEEKINELLKIKGLDINRDIEINGEKVSFIEAALESSWNFKNYYLKIEPQLKKIVKSDREQLVKELIEKTKKYYHPFMLKQIWSLLIDEESKKEIDKDMKIELVGLLGKNNTSFQCAIDIIKEYKFRTVEIEGILGKDVLVECFQEVKKELVKNDTSSLREKLNCNKLEDKKLKI